jgi:hypothetical protein
VGGGSDGIPDAIDGCPNTLGDGGKAKDDVPNHEANCPWAYNPDQKDSNDDGTRGECEAGTEETCSITLAGPYLYESAADGRIATVFRDISVPIISLHDVCRRRSSSWLTTWGTCVFAWAT